MHAAVISHQPQFRQARDANRAAEAAKKAHDEAAAALRGKAGALFAGSRIDIVCLFVCLCAWGDGQGIHKVGEQDGQQLAKSCTGCLLASGKSIATNHR